MRMPAVATHLYAFSQLGFLIRGYLVGLGLTQGLKREFGEAIAQSVAGNEWFTDKNCRQAMGAIAAEMLHPSALEAWLAAYLVPAKIAKSVGIVMAGNLPLVGFHDFVCVLCSGHKAVVKLSSKDAYLLPMLYQQLVKIDYTLRDKVVFVDAIESSLVDAVIATGSDDSSSFFETHYNHLPHIFRQSKSSVAVLTGGENSEQLQGLANDVLSYFGMGCRSVNKLLVPKNYDFAGLKEIFVAHYQTNKNFEDCYRYAKALMTAHKEEFIDFDGIVLKKSEDAYPLPAQVFFDEYENEADLNNQLQQCSTDLQCLVSANYVKNFERFFVEFGKAQRPQLSDYADYVDTMQFLCNL
ncbi:acyl-CoA reductase [Bacteroidia bacterium]|nr:acyl-CoA reductase [Bacteroidia bacterium]